MVRYFFVLFQFVCVVQSMNRLQHHLKAGTMATEKGTKTVFFNVNAQFQTNGGVDRWPDKCLEDAKLLKDSDTRPTTYWDIKGEKKDPICDTEVEEKTFTDDEKANLGEGKFFKILQWPVEGEGPNRKEIPEDQKNYWTHCDGATRLEDDDMVGQWISAKLKDVLQTDSTYYVNGITGDNDQNQNSFARCAALNVMMCSAEPFLRASQCTIPMKQKHICYVKPEDREKFGKPVWQELTFKNVQGDIVTFGTSKDDVTCQVKPAVGHYVFDFEMTECDLDEAAKDPLCNKVKGSSCHLGHDLKDLKQDVKFANLPWFKKSNK